MFDLTVTFNLIVFVAMCALNVVLLFMDVDVLACGSVKKSFKIAGIVLGAAGLAAALLLGAAGVGLKTGAITLRGDSAVIFGLELPHAARLVNLFSYPVGFILAAVAVILALLLIVCVCVKRPAKSKADDVPGQTAVNAEGQSWDKPIEPATQPEVPAAPPAIAEVKTLMNEISGLVDSLDLPDSGGSEDGEEDDEDGEEYTVDAEAGSGQPFSAEEEDDYGRDEDLQKDYDFLGRDEKGREFDLDDAAVEGETRLREEREISDGYNTEGDYGQNRMSETKEGESAAEQEGRAAVDEEQDGYIGQADGIGSEKEPGDFEREGGQGAQEQPADEEFETKNSRFEALEKQFNEDELERVATTRSGSRGDALEVDEFTVQEHGDFGRPGAFYPLPKVRTIIRKPSPANRNINAAPSGVEAAQRVRKKSESVARPEQRVHSDGKTEAEADGSPVGKDRAASDVREVRPIESELPMTKKHVLLNRRNVVNMFSDYLRSKSEDDKERIENSINTIIIK